MERDGEVTLP